MSKYYDPKQLPKEPINIIYGSTMTKEEKNKYAYELMVKNNPDEAVKTLIRFENNLKNLGMGGLHRKPDKFYNLSELPDEVNILVSPKGYGKTYHEFNKLKNTITKAQNGIKELIKFGDEWHWDNGAIRDYLIDIFNILGGKDNESN